MPISEILDFARERILLEIDKDEKRLQSDIEGIRRRHAAHGSNCLMEIQGACADAARERIKSAWGVLHRGITTVGVDYDEGIEAQLNATMEVFFPEQMTSLIDRITEAAKGMGSPDLAPRLWAEIGNARSAALAEVASEIRLFLLTLKKRPAAIPYSPQFNFHNSTIGSVQTGDKSVANVQFQTGVAEAELIKALDIVSQSLERIGDIPGCDRAEIIELVTEGKTELAKERPNKTKLATYLPAISQALSIVSDLKPAYEGLKTAAKALGYQLP